MAVHSSALKFFQKRGVGVSSCILYWLQMGTDNEQATLNFPASGLPPSDVLYGFDGLGISEQAAEERVQTVEDRAAEQARRLAL